MAPSDIKGTMFYSTRHEDVPIEPPDNLARNLCHPSREKAHLLNNYLKRHFFRSMGFVSDILRQSDWNIT